MTATTLFPAPTSRSAAPLAAATPARRDRYVDFLRVASLAVVMLGHWLMAALVWHDGRLHTTNILETARGAQWLTWVFQIMPVFFVVGGFANSVSWASTVRKGGTYGDWLGSRLTRLIRPVMAFALVWTAGVVGLRLLGVDPGAVRAGSIAQPLWFLAVYVGVVALAPIAVAAQRRWRWSASVALAVGVAAVDLARWPLGVPSVGWANLALVWLFAHQLGVAWQSGAIASWSRRRLVVLALAGLATVVALTEMAGYPHSMVGGVGEARSNTFPPSLALAALAVWQFGFVLAVRSIGDRWLARPRAWAAVVAANGMAMTVYLWHLTAMVVVAAVALPTGLMPQPAVGTAAWWAWRPLWIALLAIALVPLVATFARIELGGWCESPRLAHRWAGGRRTPNTSWSGEVGRLGAQAPNANHTGLLGRRCSSPLLTPDVGPIAKRAGQWSGRGAANAMIGGILARVVPDAGERTGPASGRRAAVAAVLLAVGLAVLARQGFVAPGMPWNLPMVAVGLLGAGWWTLRRL